MRIKSIRKKKALKGKRVLLRVDFNVPVKKGRILDEYKIISQIPTIRFLLKNKCRIILVTHLGRPEPGKINKDFSVEPIAERVGEILKKKVKLLGLCNDFKTGTGVSEMKEGEIVMLENIRFEKGEKENSRKLAGKLAKLADIYVTDAFAVSHRKHASLAAIQSYLPSYAGFLTEREIKNLDKILKPEKPFIIIIGGAKIATKVPLVKKLHKKAFRILIGGAVANNFLKARGYEVGKSLIDKESLGFARGFRSKKLILPIDVVVSSSRHNEQAQAKKIKEVSKKDYIFDIGPETIKLYSHFIKRARTLVWNGPMGMFEVKSFRHGTSAIAQTIAGRSKGTAFGVIGGGETIETMKAVKMTEYIDWVSTGGGAMLSYLGGKKMPGLKKVIF